MNVAIELHGVTKRYGSTLVIKELTHTFAAGTCTAVVGHNGSGKSTLIKLLSGQSIPSKGTLTSQGMDSEEWALRVALSAPYTELLEEFTPLEFFQWQKKFRTFRNRLNPEDVAARLELPMQALHRPISTFSSGMKQRVKLAAACFSDTPILLLDEPFSNLDADARRWGHETIHDSLIPSEKWGERLVVIASNADAEETAHCSHTLPLPKF